MYRHYSNVPNTIYYDNSDRIGGFLAPFLLGGITGGLVAPAFYRPNPTYYIPSYNNYYYPYNFYRPY